jgi:hypothetical protein
MYCPFKLKRTPAVTAIGFNATRQERVTDCGAQSNVRVDERVELLRCTHQQIVNFRVKLGQFEENVDIVHLESRMSIQFEEGKFYTAIDAPHLIVFKAVGACTGLSPFGGLNEMCPTLHRPATEAEIATWHEQKVASLRRVWSRKQNEAVYAQAALERAEKEAGKFKPSQA